MTAPNANETIDKVVRATPDWLRQNLVSKDAKVRGGAEETLSAMLNAALFGDNAGRIEGI